tara:strand:+ start:4848 stop:5381 length:534 start_codon:yes stop_codon:yes gene_type:complete
MKIKEIFPDVFYIEPPQFNDSRGFFRENFNYRDLKKINLEFNSVQDNYSFSQKKGTIRGLHFQNAPYEQAKIVYVTSGEIFDIFVDIRKGSKNYGKYYSIILNESTGFVIIPKGFAHGFCTLKDETKVLYKVDNYYNLESESGIIWNDSFLNIDWPKLDEPFLISEKDKRLKSFNLL